MRVLVIPDVHLKPWMFEKAAGLLKHNAAELAVCLMDLPDDWNQRFNLDLYEQTMDAAIDFAIKFPQTRWCYGNHDLCYQWRESESGYSPIAEYTVQKKLIELKSALPDDNPMSYIHRIDNVLFCHGGLTEDFVKEVVPDAFAKKEAEGMKREAGMKREEGDPALMDGDIDRIISQINRLGHDQMWNDDSPIWCRPQYDHLKMYRPDQYLQVVGHTPVDHITRKWNRDQNLLSCDVFSTYRDGHPIGPQKFVILDTENWSFEEESF